jgi:hypothetical protein
MKANIESVFERYLYFVLLVLFVVMMINYQISEIHLENYDYWFNLDALAVEDTKYWNIFFVDTSQFNPYSFYEFLFKLNYFSFGDLFYLNTFIYIIVFIVIIVRSKKKSMIVLFFFIIVLIKQLFITLLQIGSNGFYSDSVGFNSLISYFKSLVFFLDSDVFIFGREPRNVSLFICSLLLLSLFFDMSLFDDKVRIGLMLALASISPLYFALFLIFNLLFFLFQLIKGLNKIICMKILFMLTYLMLFYHIVIFTYNKILIYFCLVFFMIFLFDKFLKNSSETVNFNFYVFLFLGVPIIVSLSIYMKIPISLFYDFLPRYISILSNLLLFYFIQKLMIFSRSIYLRKFIN